MTYMSIINSFYIQQRSCDDWLFWQYSQRISTQVNLSVYQMSELPINLFGALVSLHQPISEGMLGSNTFNIYTQPLNCPQHVFIVDQQLHLFRLLMVNVTKKFLQTKHIKAITYFIITEKSINCCFAGESARTEVQVASNNLLQRCCFDCPDNVEDKPSRSYLLLKWLWWQ